MKKINSIYLVALTMCITLFSTCSGSDYEEEKLNSEFAKDGNTRAELITYTIEIPINSGLGYLINNGYSYLKDAQKLIITGKFNSIDAQNLPENLEILDISGAQIYKQSQETDVLYGRFFESHKKLTTIILPEYITDIEYSVFCDCSSLTSVNIPDGVTSIGGGAFAGCISLTSIAIPDGVTSIGWAAFSGCCSLTNINIPEGVTSIRENVFEGCSSLTNINIPDDVTSIGESAFEGCSSLTSINIPDGVTSIGVRAFYNCSSLTSVNIPDGVTSIEGATFYDCSSLTTINIPKGVESIGGGAFAGCISLTSIAIPDGVTSIEDSAFNCCSSLTNINIPEGVTSIGRYAFDGCNSLISVTIPESVNSIGDYAFCDCGSLRVIDWHCDQSLNLKFSHSISYLDNTIFLYVYPKDDETLPEGSGRYKYCAINNVFEMFDIGGLNGDYLHYLHGSAKKMVYTKEFKDDDTNMWHTISLPFTPTKIMIDDRILAPFDSDIEDARNFWLRELTSDGFKDVPTLEANHGYIIAMPESRKYSDYYRIEGDVDFLIEDVDFDNFDWGTPIISEGTDYCMYPTYKTVELARDVYVLNSDYWVDGYDYGTVFIRGTIGASPYEAYAKPNDNAASMRSILPINSKRTAVRGASSSNSADSRGVVVKRKPRKEDM